MMKRKSVVVIGGGTGTHTLLRGLKKYSNKLDITAVVNMSDSGGSTGRLRDEFGLLPIGDARMALAALAADSAEEELMLRELFLYRFSNGNDLKGHNLGNLLLKALSDLRGGEAAAIIAASNILRVSGTVLPVTCDNAHLTAVYDDGLCLEGEHNIDSPTKDRKGKRIIELSLKPKAEVYHKVKDVISSADMIVIGPGDLYSSLLANLVVTGMSETINDSRAKLVYISNLMERSGQTDGMSVSDSVDELIKYAKRRPDIVLVNNADIPSSVIDYYQKQDQTKPIVDDADKLTDIKVVRADLISNFLHAPTNGDVITRSLIRHDSEKVAKNLLLLL